ncbi:MAG: hypothetical protein NTX59_00060 [Elusimicrobia bacterium]|nr:hypothetical protein [Elusimicrobiota bacterium]
MDKTAYLSVYDKTGLVGFAAGLEALGFDIYASGSTYKFLKQAGIDAEEARFSPPLPVAVLKALFTGACALAENGVEVPPPSLVVCDLYPLARLAGQEDLGAEEMSLYLDTANSAVLRAAAREFETVTVLCDSGDYAPVLEILKQNGELAPERKKELAAKTYAYCAYYDGTLARYLSGKTDFLRGETVLSLKKVKDLSYGENRHQKAAFYALSGARPTGINSAKILQGGNFNLNHYLDMETAFEMVSYFEEPACVVAKHANPCGAAAGLNLPECFKAALNADRLGAFGGTAAFNREVDAETSVALSESFIETVIAAGYSGEALKILRAKKGLKVVKLAVPLAAPGEMELFSLSGGLLIEEKDNFAPATEFKIVSKRIPSPGQARALRLAWRAAIFAKSYAVVLATDSVTVAIGAGQSSTYDSARLAAMKAGQRHPILKAEAPLAAASDAALPLKTLEEILARGVSAVIEPGGWAEDAACIKFCDQKNAVLAFTGIRHLKH